MLILLNRPFNYVVQFTYQKTRFLHHVAHFTSSKSVKIANQAILKVEKSKSQSRWTAKNRQEKMYLSLWNLSRFINKIKFYFSLPLQSLENVVCFCFHFIVAYCYWPFFYRVSLFFIFLFLLCAYFILLFTSSECFIPSMELDINDEKFAFIEKEDDEWKKKERIRHFQPELIDILPLYSLRHFRSLFILYVFFWLPLINSLIILVGSFYFFSSLSVSIFLRLLTLSSVSVILLSYRFVCFFTFSSPSSDALMILN